jgi:L-asparagine oxygenase
MSAFEAPRDSGKAKEVFWRGLPVAGPAPATLVLTIDEAAVLECLAERVTASPSGDAGGFCKQLKALSKMVPERIKTVLLAFAARGTETGFLLITGLEVDDESLDETPPGNIYKRGETTMLARIQALLVTACGSEMIAYEAEGYGRLFQDVVPIQSMAALQTSVGSGVELEIHTEQAFSMIKPDILSLACLRGDTHALTHIFPVRLILDDMSEEEKQLLRQPLWTTSVDLSFKMHEHYEFLDGDIRGPMPIISSSEEDPLLVFDQDLMEGTTPEASALIKKIVDLYYQKRLSHNLRPGHVVLVDNRRAVHGRSPFFPKWDGRDRFLVRCFACLDYEERTAHARPNGGRVAAAIYS